ncbi:MAG: acetyl-CoA C-acetyltransferase [Lachnospiraceae bacterium]|nr:acetyl-CoA C-acetyltransferase [Lachnospiraceae bacterium]
MREVYIVNCCRTPVGSFGGSLKDVPAAELGAITVREALKRANVAPETVDEVLFGGVITTGLGQNIARQVAVKAGIPYSVTATAVNMVCGSGMKSVIEAARSILAGDNEIVVAGGTESMSRAPFALPDERWGARMGDKKVIDTMIRDALWDVYNDYHMGTTAENVCDVWGITREELDAFAASSQQKAERARAEGRFRDEIVPVEIKKKKETVLFEDDEYIKTGVTKENIAGLKGAFPVGPEGVENMVVHTFEPEHICAEQTGKHVQRVTAANASGLNDGAAAIIVASGEAVEKYGLKPLARLTGWGQGGVDPKIMGVGPVPASRKAMKMAGVTIGDIDLIEANEAFAAQSIAVGRELGFDMDKLNVNGGAIAIGHPVGCSGARIIVTLLYEMLKRPDAKRGLATLCIGGGMGVTTIFEKC